jgi:hypothetical protein
MGFPRGPLRRPAPPRAHVAVFAVGQRVYVACADAPSARATLTDEADKKPLASLGDGTAVAILAWRPGWSGGTRYRVRATDSDLEGWLPVGSLRSTKVAVTPAPDAPAPPDVTPPPLPAGEFGTTGHGFGQRRV